MSSRVIRLCAPAAATTFSSIMIEPRSSAPKSSDTWPIFFPCVTHDPCTWGTLSM